MASNVVSDNFETGTGGVPQLGGTGATTCKAWVNFNGIGTVAIRDSYNVSSITDLSAGKYKANFTSSLTANYSVVGSAGYISGISGNVGVTIDTDGNNYPPATYVQFRTRRRDTNVDSDVNFVSIQVFGN
jgi:hypothetical protein